MFLDDFPPLKWVTLAANNSSKTKWLLDLKCAMQHCWPSTMSDFLFECGDSSIYAAKDHF